MKTAKQFRIDKFRNEKPFYSDKSIEYLMVEFAKEAIKADRENVTKHAETKEKKWSRKCSSGYEYGHHTIVNKKSIINAPNIELL